VVAVQGVPAGYVMYAPPSAVPRAAELPSGPVSADAVLLSALQVRPEFSGEGLGRMLAQAVARDLARRGVKAVEAFGDARPGTEPSCMVPADFLRSVGFKTVRPHPRWPRLRMELRSALTWKEDVEAALEQLLGSITLPLQESDVEKAAPRPVPAVPGGSASRVSAGRQP
jgi:GNAT superfamily N-acetyltransferase